MTVLIMAAGDAARYNSIEKQLLPIHGNETIIGRQIRQIERSGHDPIVVTHSPTIAAYAPTVFMPHRRKTLCDSILSSRRWWRGETKILLGDVIFTRYGIDMVLATRPKQPVTVFGNEAELYAMSFMPSAYDQVARCLDIARHHRCSASVGKMRYFYKEYTGLPIYGGDLEHQILSWLRDETNDIDSPEEYKTTMALWNKGTG